MRTALSFFVERPLLVNLSMLLFIALGARSLQTAVYSAYPDFDFGAFSIITASPGSSPPDVELNITVPLEEELLKVDGIKQMRSNSMEGISAILVEAPDTANRSALDKLSQDLQRAIDRAKGRLPADLPEQPTLTELLPELEPTIELLVSGNVSEALLREVADQAEEEVRELAGVTGVDKRSYRKREVRILLDPMAMHQLGISVAEIERAINTRNITATAGTIQSLTAEKDVIAAGRFVDPKEVSRVIIRAPEFGNTVRIEDIAEVIDDYEDWSVRAFFNGKPGIYLGVRRSARSDELSVDRRVRALVQDLNQRVPTGITLSVTNDQARFTRTMLGTLVNNGIAGMVLVLLVLLLFYPWRASFWVVAGMPTTVFLGFALMPLFDLTVSQFTLAAIILMLGLLVDDAIVTSESIFRRFESGLPPREAATDGTAAIAPAVITGALTTVLAFLPMVFLSGNEGKFMWMLPAMVILIICASLLECKTMLPAHMAHALQRSNQRPRDPAWFRRLEHTYRRIIDQLIAYRYLSITVLTLVLLGSMAVGLRFINIDMYPESDVDTIHIKAALPAGSSFDNTYRQLRQVELLIHEMVPDNDLQSTRLTVGTHNVGRPDEVNPGNQKAWGTLDIVLHPLGVREVNALDLTRRLRQAFKRFTQFESLRVFPKLMGPPVGYPVELQVISNGPERDAVAAELLEFLRRQPGVTDVWSSHHVGKDQLNLQMKHEIIKAYGLDVADIVQTVQVAFDGYIVGQLQTIDELIKYRLQLREPERGDLTTLYSLTVTNAEGHPIPLRALVNIKSVPGQTSITHYAGNRSEAIYADIDRDATSLVAINRKVADFIASRNHRGQHPGLRIKQGGELQGQQSTVANMGGTLAVTLLAIFFVMVLLFNSLTQPLMVIAMIPMGFAGVLLAFLLHGHDLSVPAMIGFLGLAGVLVNSAIVLIDRLNQYRDERGRVSNAQIVEGATYRLRPILITSLTTVAGLAPAAYGLLGSNPFLTPMILAMLWGVAFGTLITLLYLPCFYAADQDLHRGLRHLRSHRTRERH